MHAVQTKENLCKQCVFLFYAHVQYKLQKFLAKPVFFCRFGVLIYRPRAVQTPENIFYRPSFYLLFH